MMQRIFPHHVMLLLICSTAPLCAMNFEEHLNATAAQATATQAKDGTELAVITYNYYSKTTSKGEFIKQKEAIMARNIEHQPIIFAHAYLYAQDQLHDTQNQFNAEMSRHRGAWAIRFSHASRSAQRNYTCASHNARVIVRNRDMWINVSCPLFFSLKSLLIPPAAVSQQQTPVTPCHGVAALSLAAAEPDKS